MDLFDPRKNEFQQFVVYHVDPARWDLRSMTRAGRVALTSPSGADSGAALGWTGFTGWSREFSETTQQNVTKTLGKGHTICRAYAAARISQLISRPTSPTPR